MKATVPTKGDGLTTETAWSPDTSALEQPGKVLKVKTRKAIDATPGAGGKPVSWSIEYEYRDQTRREVLAAKATLTAAELQEAAKLMLRGGA